MNQPLPTIVVLGASGLIGQAVAAQLRRDGFPVVPIARRFALTQKACFGGDTIESPIVDLGTAELAHIVSETRADIVVNCIGVLQDGSSGRTDAVHQGFVIRLVEALARLGRPVLLMHLSIPGRDSEDRTSFSLTKREAERAIAAGAVPFVVLRAGFVVAPAAYGGSALVRALAVLPLGLPLRENRATLAATDAGDLARTIAIVARRWHDGERNWNAVWEVMERRQSTVSDVLDAFRQRLGGPAIRLRLPSWLMDAGAKAGDFAALLGWAPPVRSTALQEMRRGVEGNPERWIAATGIEPTPLGAAVQSLPATVQEKWFARLYLAKPLVIGSLVLFWSVSGLIALAVAFEPATEILSSQGFPPRLAQAMIVSGLTDMGIGVALAFKKTCRIGLLIGIGVTVFYMTGAAIITPDLWLEPFGALVGTVPAIVLMLVALAILEDR